ncbi:hypothetical protein BGZ60DRAFT_65390 [Tricladium varicosporioides]|nr:hypothetical protein BGZ60DRAFT_65390 [Hymenoscyphus varicosporioides]
MSDPISSATDLSDITEFATWELEHNQTLLSEREISLLDDRTGSGIGRMVRDSSNDARSSDSEAQRETLNRGFEISNSTQDPGSQKSNGSQRKREKKRTKKARLCEDVRDSRKILLSQQPTQDIAEAQLDLQSSQIHPPSSQPRPPSSLISAADEDDPLAEFDLTEEDSQFFRELLEVAPEEEVNQLKGDVQVAVQQQMINQGEAIQVALGKVVEIAGGLSQQLASSMEAMNYNPIIHPGKKRKRTGPQLETSQDWYVGDEKVGVEVAVKPVEVEKKAKKVKLLSQDELEKKRIYEEKKAARKARKAVETNSTAATEVAEPTENTSKPKIPKAKKNSNTNAVSKEVHSVVDSKSDKITGAEKRRKKKLATQQKKAALGPTKSGYFAIGESVKEGSPKTKERRAKKLTNRAKAEVEKTLSPVKNRANSLETHQKPLPEVSGEALKSQKQMKKQERLAKALDRTRKEAEKAGLPQHVIDSLVQSKKALESAKAGPIVQKVSEESVVREKERKAKEEDTKKSEADKKLAKKEKRKRKRSRNHNKAYENDKIDINALAYAKPTAPIEEHDVNTAQAALEITSKPKQKEFKKSRMEIVAEEIAQAKATDRNTDGSGNVTADASSGQPESSRKRRDRGRKPKAHVDEVTTTDGPAPEVEITNGYDLVPEGIDEQPLPDSTTAKNSKRRDRGRKSLDTQDPAAGFHEELLISSPLAELPDTNSKNSKADRQNQSEKKVVADVDTEVLIQGSKAHHS